MILWVITQAFRAKDGGNVLSFICLQQLDVIPCSESFDLVYYTPNFAKERRRYARLKMELRSAAL